MSVTISQLGPDPLPPAVTKLLVDKLYEKRKTAALDVEKIIRDFLAIGNHQEISRIVKFLSNNYVLSQNQNNKKGGLIGLAACAIALGKEAQKYRSDLVPSVLACFSDPDSRVRYYGCEALYNIVKVLRASVLIYFNEIFDGLCKLCCDLDLNVRNGAELLDRLLKDTVTENSGNERFDIIVFMQLLRERIYVKNSYVRQFLVSWLKVLDSEPNIDVISHISDLLDGLFNILDDNNPEIKKMCECLLDDFLKEITSPLLEKIKYDSMINIILVHSANMVDDSIQHTAMIWLKELINIVGDHSLYFMPGILNVTLPCLSYPEENYKGQTKEIAKSINATLGGLVDVPREVTTSIGESLAIDKIIESLSKFMITPSDQQNVNTTIESLKWILHLVDKQPEAILARIDDFFPILISFLSDPFPDVVDFDLQILSRLSTSRYFINTNKQSDYLKVSFPEYNDYFTRFLTLLLDLFRNDKDLRYTKGSNMIKKLCDLLNSEDMFRMLAEILVNESDPEFSISMVDILNTILLTSSELHDLRNLLKDFDNSKSYSLFVCLYKTWCHNPIATLALCLLSQNYEHAFNLVNLFGDIEITFNLLMTIDKLVQLIESSIFTYLRLHLLRVESNQYLVRALYGLLMILPQSDAFLLLKQRLDCVPNYYNKVNVSDALKENEMAVDKSENSIDFEDLLKHFIGVQKKHKFFKKNSRLMK